MRARHIALVASLLLSTACGATLVRGPTGWHEGERSYSIAPLDNGDLVPAGWTLKGYSQRKDGFRRDDSALYLALELDVRRMQDDGILGVQSYWLDEPDRAKRPEVLADRWFDRVVQNPKTDDEMASLFADVVPPLKMTATTEATQANGLNWRSSSSSTTALFGHNLKIERRETFAVTGGEASETTATLSPREAPPDRKLYLAILKPTAAGRYVVVAYANTPTMFDGGLAEATSFAHRIHF